MFVALCVVALFWVYGKVRSDSRPIHLARRGSWNEPVMGRIEVPIGTVAIGAYPPALENRDG